jgi:nicotinamidase-related amidase
MNNSAVIVIDIQKGFLDPTNSWYTSGSELIIDTILRVCSKFPVDRIFFSAFVNYPSNDNKSKKFLVGSTETEIINPLKHLVRKDNLFQKNMYSVFKIEELSNKLKFFDTVYICGLEGDACVLFSSAEAYDLFINFKVIEDAVAGFDVFGGHSQFMEFYRNHFGDCLINSADLK